MLRLQGIVLTIKNNEQVERLNKKNTGIKAIKGPINWRV